MSTLRGARIVIKDLKKNGFEAFIVGGAVRDHLLKMPITDVDITTNAKPHQVAKLFKTKPTGIKYGTVTVLLGQETLEVTTYRIDGTYIDSRHPENVTFSETVEEDVQRRDFRMNGLLMNEVGEIIDYVDGRKDIKEKIIRTIGNPVDRFTEDALRIMRAFYFQSKLGFQIEKETREAITEMKDNLNHVAMERIVAELIKMLKGPYAKRAIKSMVTTGVHAVLPGLQKGLIYIDQMDEIPFVDAFFTLCFTLHGSVPDAWTFSNKHRHKYQTASLLANQNTVFDALTLHTYGLEICLLANKVNYMLNRSKNMKTKIEDAYQNLGIQSELDLKLRANDILKLTDKKAGAWLKNLQREMVLAVINKEVENEKNALTAFVLKRLNKETL
ncbi:MAG: CCA tRNA nucleotidyltransferase [Acholeplasmataceae bacterium]|nr:CCA tRNA nucleotidyltransferase [Acholeplasmataceae bacterium]